MNIILYIIISGILALIIHEAGHFISSLILTGNILKFHFEFGYLWKIPVPRFIWYMPNTTERNQSIIAISGFGLEFLALIPFYIFSKDFVATYRVVIATHLLLYQFYAGDSSDFKWF